MERARWFERHREKGVIKFLPELSDDAYVLDLGCGTGLITRKLKGQVTGLDINAWAIKRACKHAPNGQFIVGDAEKQPFKSNNISCGCMCRHS